MSPNYQIKLKCPRLVSDTLHIVTLLLNSLSSTLYIYVVVEIENGCGQNIGSP